MKYFFISNVRLEGQDVSAQMLGYATLDEAEIKYHDEVSYALKLNNVELAHFEVRDETGKLYDMLVKTIDNRVVENPVEE
jgi:glutathionylspermidine synthase